MFYGTILNTGAPVKLNSADVNSPIVHISNAALAKGGD